MAAGIIVSVRRNQPKPSPVEFSYPYGWSNSKASPQAIVAQMLTSNPNPHDIRVASARFGSGVLYGALAALDQAGAWPSAKAGALARRAVRAFAPAT